RHPRIDVRAPRGRRANPQNREAHRDEDGTAGEDARGTDRVAQCGMGARLAAFEAVLEGLLRATGACAVQPVSTGSRGRGMAAAAVAILLFAAFFRARRGGRTDAI